MAYEEQDPKGDHIDSTDEDPERQRLVQQAGELLLSVLDSQRPMGVRTRESGKVTTASEFVAALERLDEAGWAFDASSSPALLCRVSDLPPSADDKAILGELQERYPSLPEEIAEIALCILTGNKIVSETDHGIEDLQAKSEVVERLVLTEEVRERFYLRACGKVPRFFSVDWEVVVKAAERGHSASPFFPYALASFDAISDVHGHHEHEILTFAIGAHGLDNLINDLEALKMQLERVRGKLHESAVTVADNLGDNDA